VFAIGGRVPLTLAAPWSAVRCEVDSIDAEPVRQLVAHRVAQYLEADDIGAQVAAREALASILVSDGRPVWDLVTAKGPVPPTESGCLFIPTALLLALVDAWLDTFEPKPRRKRA